MQIYDADFYPLKDKTKRINAFKISALTVSAVLLLLLGLRAWGWIEESRDTRLLVLINEWNSLEQADFKPRLKETENGFRLDKSCIKDFERMMADCRKSGAEPELLAAYRDEAEQERLFKSEERKLEAQGLSPELAIRSVSRPGRSEHQLGLAVDIGEASENTGSTVWLKENSWRYGFILRYPEGKEDTTGINYTPQHYRYVGHAAAKQIYDMGICLEDYIEMFYSQEAVIKIEN